MKEQIDEQIICKREVFDNIQRVRNGQPLTKPLKLLNQFCEFKKEWDNIYDLTHEEEIKEEVKARMKAYDQKPEVKAYHKAYQKAYNQKPEVKAYHKAYYQKHKQKIEELGK